MADALFVPSNVSVESSTLFKALHDLNTEREARGEAALEGYQGLHRWSCDEPEAFWLWALDTLNIQTEGSLEPAITNEGIGARFFPNATLNVVDNILAHGAPDATAIVALSESRGITSRTFKELSDEVDALAYYLQAIGIQPGDRVAGLTSNSPEAVTALLATAAIGAIYTSASPEFGLDALIARFGQVQPKVVIACNGYSYGGKLHDARSKVNNLLKVIPSIEHIILYEESPELDLELYVEIPAVTFDAATSCAPDATFERPLFPFNHPLYVLYSSGTSGAPKCLVHGVGGTLLQHAKEHRLHGDLRAGDKLFFIATSGWMTWNWLISGLQAGATVCLYDGAPNPEVLWNFARDQEITHFGGSPGFFQRSHQQSHIPDALPHLRTLYSTGSTLTGDTMSALQAQLPEARIQSVCGGTDIISCFVLGNPLDPIFAGEIQCAGLGMDVQIQQSAETNGGELCCRTPFPSMPVELWGDPDGTLYRETYLPDGDDVWHQGDLIEQITHDQCGPGYHVVGRIDGTLNPRGIRFGPAEVYSALHGLDGIADTLTVSDNRDAQARFVICVQPDPECPKDESELQSTIIDALSTKLSPKHKPDRIIFVQSIPKTLSGKKVESLVSKALNPGAQIDTTSLQEPASFDALIEHLLRE